MRCLYLIYLSYLFSCETGLLHRLLVLQGPFHAIEKKLREDCWQSLRRQSYMLVDGNPLTLPLFQQQHWLLLEIIFKREWRMKCSVRTECGTGDFSRSKVPRTCILSAPDAPLQTSDGKGNFSLNNRRILFSSQSWTGAEERKIPIILLNDVGHGFSWSSGYMYHP